MGLYLSVEGDLKGILETQAILVSLLKVGKIHSLNIPQLTYGLSQAFEIWLVTYIPELTHRLVNYINAANELWVVFLCTA